MEKFQDVSFLSQSDLVSLIHSLTSGHTLFTLISDKNQNWKLTARCPLED